MRGRTNLSAVPEQTGLDGRLPASAALANGGYARMFRRFMLITLCCSVLPLLLVGWGISTYYSRFAAQRMDETFQQHVAQHKRAIELFLDDRTSAIQLTAQTQTLESLCDPARLAWTLEVLNREYGKSFTDLGVIGAGGEHLSYVGPYDLKDKNYAEEIWFKQVVEHGVYVSDMFLGFRGVPHFVIAVSRIENGMRWILRATVDTEVFRALVEGAKIGNTGEVYLVNAEGSYQTRPRRGGEILQSAKLAVEPVFDGIRVETVEGPDSTRQVVAHAWLGSVRWRLVVEQDHEEAYHSVNHARYMALAFLHVCAATILLVSVLTSRYMIRIVRRRDEAAQSLDRQLVQAGKMASIGELAAGVAHEVNNPLAIILTERQILLDKADRTEGLEPSFEAQLRRSLEQIGTQCKRCKHTTQNLLRFSRRTKSRMEEVDLNAFLCEAIELLEREAKSSGIKFFADFDVGLQPIVSDASQLQQVFLNLLSNAIDAHDGKPYGRITISTRLDQARGKVEVVVADTGGGIRPEHLEKVFDPFFTTKPVGKGTGLGLSICYGIVQRLGGDIRVESEPGEGTTFTIVLPLESKLGPEPNPTSLGLKEESL